MVIHKPPATFYLKQAAGIQRGAMQPGNVFNIKHNYAENNKMLII